MSSSISLPPFLRQGLLPNLELSISARLAGLKVPGILLSLHTHPSTTVTNAATASHFMYVLGIWSGPHTQETSTLPTKSPLESHIYPSIHIKAWLVVPVCMYVCVYTYI